MSALPERVFLVLLFAIGLFAESSRAVGFAHSEKEFLPNTGTGWTAQFFWAEAEEENEETDTHLVFGSATVFKESNVRKGISQLLNSACNDWLSSLYYSFCTGRMFLLFTGVLQI
jgi:hypothetical protein